MDEDVLLLQEKMEQCGGEHIANLVLHHVASLEAHLSHYAEDVDRLLYIDCLQEIINGDEGTTATDTGTEQPA